MFLVTTMIFIITAASLLLSLLLLSLMTIRSAKEKSRTKSSNDNNNLPPGSFGWPIIGETIEYILAQKDVERPQRFMEERRGKYESSIFKTSIMGEPAAALCGPAGNKFLFSNENKLVSIWWPPAATRLLGPCILTTTGDEGRAMRKVVATYLSHEAFSRHYIKVINSVTRQHMSDHWLGKEEVKVFPTTKLFSFELGCRLYMSLEDAQIAKLVTPFRVLLQGVTSIIVPVNLPGTAFYRANKAKDAIRNQLIDVVRQRRSALEHNKTSTTTSDLLSHLLLSPDENGKFMSESLIVNNIIMLLAAGPETVASAITTLMKYLAQYPDTYEKVLREQNKITSSPSKNVEWEDIQKMRYSWNVVCETMRLSPPALGSLRVATADINYAGYHIPKGWKLYWSSYLTHRDPSFFPDYLKFDPSRFEGLGPAPFSYVPFGGGPRTCLGREFARIHMLIFLHNVITRFNWKLVNPDEVFEYCPTLAPANGLPIRLQPHVAVD